MISSQGLGREPVPGRASLSDGGSAVPVACGKFRSIPVADAQAFLWAGPVIGERASMKGKPCLAVVRHPTTVHRHDLRLYRRGYVALAPRGFTFQSEARHALRIHDQCQSIRG